MSKELSMGEVVLVIVLDLLSIVVDGPSWIAILAAVVCLVD